MRGRTGATLSVALLAAAAARAGADCATNPLANNCESAATREPLVQTVRTTAPRSKIADFLVGPAQRAAKARDWARAIPLYQALVVARGARSPEAKQLATLWTLAGQNEHAAEAWADYAEATDDAAERTAALAEAQRLGANPDPFADKLSLAALVPDAKRAFALGRAAFGKKQYGDALVYFHVGYMLAPELAGFLRELGATYDKLGADAEKRAFYRKYLVQRPFGPNADVVRAELPEDELGTLLVSSSLPCTELWVNRQRLDKLPAKGIAVAPGSYKGLCFNPTYEMALFEYATVEPGKPAMMAFRWAIVENQLERPLGRIALENPKSPGVMIDLGITSPAVGVAAPADGRRLKMVLKDDSGTRTEERLVDVEAGQRLVVRW